MRAGPESGRRCPGRKAGPSLDRPGNQPEREEVHQLQPPLELAAFFSAQTVQSLTHAARITFPERLKDGRLTDELTDLILRYLTKDQGPVGHVPNPLIR